MLYYTILSICSNGFEYTDEIVSSIPEIQTFKIGDILQETLHYPERTIIHIKLKAL